ncbi:MAG: DUF748 domain-containing protein [Hydrogenophilales bacterium]|nr:DUF748 domain-containing protein [Hydrogenophilales bacterium]
MLARLRTFLLKLPVLIILCLVALYFLFGYFAFGPLAKWGAEKFITDKTGHRLTLAEPEFDPLALSVKVRDLKLAEPNGAPLLAFNELFVDFEARSLFKWAYTFETIRLSGPKARVELKPDGSLNWMPFIEALKDKEDKPDKELPRLLINLADLDKGSVEFVDHKVSGGFTTQIEPIEFQLVDISTLPDDKGDYTLSTRTRIGAQVRWKGELGLNPILATGDLAVDDLQLDKVGPYLKSRLNMAPPTGKASMTLSYRAGYAEKHLSLKVDKLGMRVENLALRGVNDTQPSVALGLVRLGPASFDLDKRELLIPEIVVDQGRIDLARRADGRLNIQDWFKAGAVAGKSDAPATAPVRREDGPPTDKAEVGQGKIKAAASPAKPELAKPWRVTLQRFSLDNIAARFTDATFVTPLSAEVGRIQVGFRADAETGVGAPQAHVQDLGVALTGLRLLTSRRPEPLFSLGRFAVEQAGIDLAARQAQVSRVVLSDGKTSLVRAANGSLPLAQALAMHPVTAKPGAAAADKSGESSWKYKVDAVDLSKFTVDVRDEAVAPALTLNLVDVRASVKGISENLKAALPVKVGLRVSQGGSLEAEGRMVPATPSAALNVKLADLNLTPVQPYLSKDTNLVLSSGRLSTKGALTYAKSVAYAGGFSVDDLLLNESVSGDRFLAWNSLATDALKATPEGVDIGALKAEGFGLKFIINKDKTTNLKQIMKPAPPSTAEKPVVTPQATPVVAAKAPPTATPGPAKAPFLLAIDTIQIAAGEMDFADLSLALPFGTRIHALKGHVNGVSSATGNAPAQLELEGQVDEYGLARAVGQINLLDPTAFTDVRTLFRNVEMARLTPYSATFAGRKIESGKLSLDLEYKIKQRQLQGDNQIIMDKLTLGERVESPTAKNLPLDLAIAILQDSDGKIDLGLPVSGSLDDPKFSYGGIIWKAIVNVLTKIVLAPFKALGALLGGNAEKMEAIGFDVGRAQLLPPEREKLKQLAGALAKRPGLALSVKGTYNPVADRAFLREDQLRRAVALHMGVKLTQEMEPAPIATTHPKVRQALEALYAERQGKVALEKLQSFHTRANPEKKEGVGKLFSKFTGLFKGKEEPLPPEEMEALKGADLHEVMYRRLLADEKVPDEALIRLAQQRAQAILDELAGAGGVPRERLGSDPPEKVEGGETVNARLALGTAKKPAAPAEK